MSAAYWSQQVEAEQLRDDNVPAAKALLQKYGFAVIEVDGDDGTFLLYEQRSGPRLIRSFIRPGQWIQITSTRSGETFVKAKDFPPAGPRVTP
jgi:hypothetical protein